jgi:hypothetical protein
LRRAERLRPRGKLAIERWLRDRGWPEKEFEGENQSICVQNEANETARPMDEQSETEKNRKKKKRMLQTRHWDRDGWGADPEEC